MLHRHAVIDRLQQAARRRRHPPHRRIVDVHFDIGNPPAHVRRPNRPPVQALQPLIAQLQARARLRRRRHRARRRPLSRRPGCRRWRRLERLHFAEQRLQRFLNRLDPLLARLLRGLRLLCRQPGHAEQQPHHSAKTNPIQPTHGQTINLRRHNEVPREEVYWAGYLLWAQKITFQLSAPPRPPAPDLDLDPGCDSAPASPPVPPYFVTLVCINSPAAFRRLTPFTSPFSITHSNTTSE